MVHRDLKPENVMVNAQGLVKITDFGIAKATGTASTRSFVTAAGTTVGTPNYMAPEQAMGQEVGPWTDLYSLGVIAFELFVGHVPFYDTDEPMAVLMRQVNDPIPPPRSLNPEVDPAISDWIERLLVKDPKKRTQSAAEASDELEEIIIGLAGPRWRRSAPLVGASERPRDVPAGPHTPPPTTAARPPLMPTLGGPELGSRGHRSADAPARGRRASPRLHRPSCPTRRRGGSRSPRADQPRRGRGTLLKIALVALATLADPGGRLRRARAALNRRLEPAAARSRRRPRP